MQSYSQRKAFERDPAIVRLAAGAQSRDHSSSSTIVAGIAEEESGINAEGPLKVPEENRHGGSAGKGEEAANEVVDPFLVTFLDTSPKHNPHNWSTLRKWLVVALVSQMAIVVGFASSVNSGAAQYAAQELHVSSEVMSLDTALFLIGFGVSSPLLGPLSEIGGRNPVYIVTPLIFSVLEVGCGFATNIRTRLVLRFLAGAAGATPLSAAGGTLGDLFTPIERALAFPLYAAAGFWGPCFGPVVGGFIGLKFDYRWCDFVSAIWGAAILVACLFVLPETFEPAILKVKSKVLRHATGDKRWKTALERERERVPFRVHFVEAMQRPFQMFFKEPIVLFFSLYLSVSTLAVLYLATSTARTDEDARSYIVLFGNLIAFPVVYGPRGLNTGEVGLCFIPISLGVTAVGGLAPVIVKAYQKEMDKAAARGLPRVPPEERLRLAMIGTWCLPISLFWFAWTSSPSISIWSSLIAQFFFGVGIAVVFISSYQYIIDAYLSTAASALAVLTAIRYPVSGAAVLFVGPMFSTLGNEWALTLLAFLSLAFCFIPWVFYFYGPTIRSWSRYTPHLPGE